MLSWHPLRSGTVAIAAFLVFTWLTTQVHGLRDQLPFTEDPWDAVTSYALIGIGVVGGVTVVRALGAFARREGPGTAQRIVLGVSVCVVIAAVTLASDAEAVVVVPQPGDLSVGAMLALMAVPGVAALAAVMAVWESRSTLREAATESRTGPDLLDEVDALVGSVGAVGLAGWLATWLETSPLSPRRHRILVGVVGGLVAGVGASVWHAIREGAWASPMAAVVFGCLFAIGVTGAYLLGLGPLRLVRSPEVTSRTS